ncbi:YvcK family protein [Candidatus Gracilibacteria bacterium]|nr:YvcK family protein [Candidatus Gracilibacteria bacterium]
MTKKINITTIGGGSGTFNVIYGLKKVFDEETRNLSTIIAMTDSGGTTGEIRDKYGVLPPGDIRRAICALASNTGMVRKLFEYKFKDETGVIGGNKVGNIILAALGDITGSFEKGLDEACKFFDVEGKIIPVTLDDVHLGVEFEDGTKIIGEKNIDISDKNDFERSHNINQNVIDAFLVGGDGILNPKAREVILNSDYIILGPGDFYTSIVPNLLSKGMKEALKETNAKIIYVCNIMTKKGETTTYELKDFIDNIEKYAGEVIDYVFVNNGHISEELALKYKIEEGKKPVKLKDYSLFEGKKYKIIERDFVDEGDVVRHHPLKLAKTMKDLVSGWIK